MNDYNLEGKADAARRGRAVMTPTHQEIEVLQAKLKEAKTTWAKLFNILGMSPEAFIKLEENHQWFSNAVKKTAELRAHNDVLMEAAKKFQGWHKAKYKEGFGESPKEVAQRFAELEEAVERATSSPSIARQIKISEAKDRIVQLCKDYPGSHKI